jgi:hypothetical protein
MRFWVPPAAPAKSFSSSLIFVFEERIHTRSVCVLCWSVFG